MSLVNDSEKLRWICRIMAITFRIAKDQPAGTISRSWVVRYLKRSEDFVKRNWKRDQFDCEMDSRPAQVTESLSQESKEIITESLAREKKVSGGFKRRLNRFEGRKRVLQASTGFSTPLVPRLSIRFQHQNCHRKMWRTACGFVSF